MLDLQSLQDDLPSLEPAPELPSTFDDVTQTSRALTDGLFSDWHQLKDIIKNLDDLVQKRWRSKTRDQKRSVLLEAWGYDMSDHHRPDLTLFIDTSHKEPSHSLDAYKWPSVNLEDLLRPRVLPTFLNSRGSHHPYVFCHADLSACALGISAGKIGKNDMKGYKMLFLDTDTHQNYAELVPESDTNNSAYINSTGSWFSVGQGLLILELQQRIYHFLIACAKLIIHDLVSESSQDSTSGPELQPSPLATNESTFVTLAISTMDAPYRTPAQLDMHRLNSLVTAKRSAIADHIWLLREDPSYFADCVNEWKEHQPEMLLDAQGKKHPIHKAGLTKAFWNRVLRKMITDALLSLSLWEYTHQEVCKFEELSHRYPDPSPLQPLPEETVFAIKKIRHLLELSAASSIALIRSHVPPSPPMLSYWHREGTSTADHHSTKFRMMLNTRISQDPALDRLFWAYTTLWDDKQSPLVGLDTLVDELDRLTYADTKAKDLQSALVVDNLGDLGVTSECLHQLSLYYPWSRDTEQAMARDRQQVVEEFYTKSAEWDNFRKMSWQGVDLADLGSPGDGRFSYPISNRRTKTNASALHKAEFHLDAFWSEVDKHLASQSVILPDRMMRLLLSGKRSLHRTSEWEEPVVDIPKGKMNGRSNGKSQGKINGKFNSNSNDERNGKPACTQNFEAAITPLSSTYLQLRGSHKRQSSIQESVSITRDSQDADVLATNGQRGAKENFTAATVSTSDFVHAMLSIGFVVEKLYASVWHFTPPESVPGESIQFHAPHVGDKIRYHMARLFGRRLQRAYDWNEGMFVVQQ
ncbi:unnamed protein product [Aureobasidium vineae]|uniref:Uncharacterized protein n=1 Tax=Aureobasidium vineae TaxID=2773715 RepID=A0A9N8P6V2_9PEZI|nr:unnamed protein product [Aureobasidium vineae]